MGRRLAVRRRPPLARHGRACIIGAACLSIPQVAPPPWRAHESPRAVRTSPDALQAGLGRGLRSAYLVTGAEPLLIAEAAAAIRQAARAAGYADREVHFIERGFDWDELLRDSANLSLFATRRLIELKFSSTPDAEAQRVLASLAAQPPADTVLLVAGELDRKPLGAAWVKAFEQDGVLVVTQPVERDALPGWIRERLGRHGVGIDPAAAQVLADRVEGNLLAAQQDVERIALLMPGATLGAGGRRAAGGRQRALRRVRARPPRHSPASRSGRCASSRVCARKGASRRSCSGRW